MKKNYIKCGDCLELLETISDKSVDVIFTSPPYGTGRKYNTEARRNNYESRYDVYLDNRTEEEYADWCCDLFDSFDRVLCDNGVVLWNVSYGNDSCQNSYNMLWFSIAQIISETNFCIADKITWKKKTAIPNNVSPNKLTRICEDVFVFVRKKELKTFNANKDVVSVSKKGQKIYDTVYNFVEAKNNDGSCPLNKATFSSELVEKILKLYAPISWGKDCIVLDPFNGTGTTGVACKKLGISYIGFELSKEQCKWSIERIKNTGV